MLNWLKNLFTPDPGYDVIRVYDDCEIRRDHRSVWVHITNRELYFSRLRKKQEEIMLDFERS